MTNFNIFHLVWIWLYCLKNAKFIFMKLFFYILCFSGSTDGFSFLFFSLFREPQNHKNLPILKKDLHSVTFLQIPLTFRSPSSRPQCIISRQISPNIVISYQISSKSRQFVLNHVKSLLNLVISCQVGEGDRVST